MQSQYYSFFCCSWAILLRLFNEGTVHYSFNVDKSAIWSGWVRYTRKMDKTVRCEINGKKFKADSAATTEKTAKKDTWGWVKLFKTSLSIGRYELVMLPSAWKIDCMLITPDADYIPTDEVELAHRERKLTEKERALMNRSVIPLVPDFINEMPDYALPEWFDTRRVQLHTRLSPRTYVRNRELFFNASSKRTVSRASKHPEPSTATCPSSISYSRRRRIWSPSIRTRL